MGLIFKETKAAVFLLVIGWTVDYHLCEASCTHRTLLSMCRPTAYKMQHTTNMVVANVKQQIAWRLLLLWLLSYKHKYWFPFKIALSINNEGFGGSNALGCLKFPTPKHLIFSSTATESNCSSITTAVYKTFTDKQSYQLLGEWQATGKHWEDWINSKSHWACFIALFCAATMLKRINWLDTAISQISFKQ